MKTLSEYIRQVQKYRLAPESSLNLISPAYGPVILKEISGDGKIEVYDESRNVYTFDKYGRIHPKGSCLLFPETKESWDIYLKRVTDEYYDNLIRIGDVCLVKVNEESDWELAIYEGKFDGRYKARKGVTTEEFEYCISYKENSSYLGRSMFPDYMLTGEGEIET